MRPRLPLGSGEVGGGLGLDRRYPEIVAAAMREGIYDPDVRVGLEVVPAALGAPTPA